VGRWTLWATSAKVSFWNCYRRRFIDCSRCGIGLALHAIARASAWRKSWAKCPHGIDGGETRNRCDLCVCDQRKNDEDLRRQVESEERWRKIDTDAFVLRDQECACLANLLAPTLEQMRQLTWQQFEDAVARMFERRGYSVKQTPYTNDHGRDAILTKNGKKYLLECKKYGADRSSRRPDLQKFYAAIMGDRAISGFFVTTGAFTREAVEYAATVPIELIDGRQLIKLMFESRSGSSNDTTSGSVCRQCGEVVHHSLQTPRLERCPNGHDVAPTLNAPEVLAATEAAPTCECGAAMRLIHWNGRRFWGCTRYPSCRGTRSWRDILQVAPARLAARTSGVPVRGAERRREFRHAERANSDVAIRSAKVAFKLGEESEPLDCDRRVLCEIRTGQAGGDPFLVSMDGPLLRCGTANRKDFG
jgi:ssDNA-binding Zn-finger/Zn-ribbon topoisomerase 1